MGKYTIEIEDEIVNFFKENIDDTENTEAMLAKMLKILYEIFKIAPPK